MRRFLIILVGLFVLGCSPEGKLEGSLIRNGQASLALSCDMINGDTTHAPFTACGVYDNTNQIVCSCNHVNDRIEEAFFETPENRDHWLVTYPNVQPTFNGESPYNNTGNYHLVIRYPY